MEAGDLRSDEQFLASTWKKLHCRNPVFARCRWAASGPQGWLARQLRIQADGLSGHLDEFWPDIKDSRWFGGEAEGWERAPYWLDGVIPLAFLLDDAALKAKVTRYCRLHHRAPGGGWLARPRADGVDGRPKPDTLRNYDIWAQFLILKALVQYGDATGDRTRGALRSRNACAASSGTSIAPRSSTGAASAGSSR